MNERIEQLAERATKEMDQEAFSEDMNIPAEWYHKFAELIAAECISVVTTLSPDYPLRYKNNLLIEIHHRDQIEEVFRRDCVEEVKQHFGLDL